MEYEILGIPETSSIEDAKKALNKLRLLNSSDKVNYEETGRATFVLYLAERAYTRIEEKINVRNILENFMIDSCNSTLCEIKDKKKFTTNINVLNHVYEKKTRNE